jgi:hypothetical protein
VDIEQVPLRKKSRDAGKANKTLRYNIPGSSRTAPAHTDSIHRELKSKSLGGPSFPNPVPQSSSPIQFPNPAQQFAEVCTHFGAERRRTSGPGPPASFSPSGRCASPPALPPRPAAPALPLRSILARSRDATSRPSSVRRGKRREP